MMDTLVIGVGNPFRGDDVAGLLVARGLRRRALPDVLVKESDGSTFSLLAAWEGAQRVVVIDAISTGKLQPGEVLVFDAVSGPLPAERFSVSTHAFGVREAVELARTLGSLPAELLVVGIVGEQFSMTEAVTPAVAAAVETLVATWPSRLQPSTPRRKPCTSSL